MKRFKYFALFLVFFLAVFSVVGVSGAHAAPFHSVQTFASAGKGDACNGLSQVGGSCGTGQSDIGGVLRGVVEIISYIAGILAIIMIIISAIRFITAGGSTERIGTAKTTLVYALIGIAVAGLAQVLVHVVISQAANP